MDLLTRNDLEKLLKINTELAFEAKPSDFFQRVIEELSKFFPFDLFNGVILRNQEIVSVEYNIPEKVMERYSQMAHLDVLQTKHLNLIPKNAPVFSDVKTWDEILEGELLEKHPISQIFHPAGLHQGLVNSHHHYGELTGYICLSRTKNGTPFGEKEKQILSIFSDLFQRKLQQFFQDFEIRLYQKIFELEKVGFFQISASGENLTAKNLPAEEWLANEPDLKTHFKENILFLEQKSGHFPLIKKPYVSCFKGKNSKKAKITFTESTEPFGLSRQYRILIQKIDCEAEDHFQLKTFFERYHFSPAEKTIVRHLKDSPSNKILAQELCICVATLKTHIKNILKKTGAKNQKNLIVIISRLG